MNRRRRQSLRRRLKAQPSDPGRPWGSAKALTKKVAPGVLIALSASVAIGVGAFFLFTLGNIRAKHSANSQIAAAKTPVEKERRTNPASTNLDTAHSGSIVGAEPAPDRSPVSTPVPTAAPLPQSTAVVSDNKSRDVKWSETERKSVERGRRAAERKRSRLEAMYQKHEISSEAYKKGQDEYKSEMAKYRSAVTGPESTNE